ncbi:uncharacterized protein [Triticum aestivum]|uniref:uncharacterized protein isoform X2 n=1 Tax=Triticum aestivum TaxID=4565 RepID=UPI001D00A3F4|nr:uncharacterized protein LOC123144288 isoform X2 [Triticum aestivum]
MRGAQWDQPDVRDRARLCARWDRPEALEGAQDLAPPEIRLHARLEGFAAAGRGPRHRLHVCGGNQLAEASRERSKAAYTELPILRVRITSSLICSRGARPRGQGRQQSRQPADGRGAAARWSRAAHKEASAGPEGRTGGRDERRDLPLRRRGRDRRRGMGRRLPACRAGVGVGRQCETARASGRGRLGLSGWLRSSWTPGCVYWAGYFSGPIKMYKYIVGCLKIPGWAAAHPGHPVHPPLMLIDLGAVWFVS